MTTQITEHQIAPDAPQDDPTSLLPKKLGRARPLFDPKSSAVRPERPLEAEPGHPGEESGDVRR